MRKARRCLAAVLPVLVVLCPRPSGATPTPAAAQTKGDAKARCAISYEQAQELRRQGKWTASRSELLVCEATCSAALASDCKTWQSEIDAVMPTALFEATDARDHPTAARVLLDGQILLERTSDVPVAIDPGDHTFHFESPSGQTQDVRASIRAGERGRVIKAIFPPAAAVGAFDSGHSGGQAVPTASYGLGAVGVALLGVAGVLTLAGHVQVGHLRSSCAPHCSSAEVDTVRDLYDAAWVGGGLGLASLAAAVLVWQPWARPDAAPSPERAGLFVTPMTGGALVGLRFP